MPYKIAICDDNPTDTEYVSSIVNTWAAAKNHIVTIHTFPSAEAFLFHYAEDKNYDILLLDIEMGEMNGVELAKQIRKSKNPVQIIFVTGFPDFMAEGYDVSALHYLMKPISCDKVSPILDRAVANLAKKEKYLSVSFDREMELVPLSKIMYVEAQKQYISIHTTDEVYRMKSSLAEVEKSLDQYFFKCQRSYIVNLSYVLRIKSGSVILKNGEEVPISRGMSEKIGKAIIQLF